MSSSKINGMALMAGLTAGRSVNCRLRSFYVEGDRRAN